MVNVAQNEDFFSTTAFVPTLLKSSLVFCLSPGINRLMTPLECFTVMGMHAHKQGKFPCHLDAFFKAQRSTSPKDMCCLAGNSMHMAAVGAVLMFALSTVHTYEESRVGHASRACEARHDVRASWRRVGAAKIIVVMGSLLIIVVAMC